jgi:hypothetical protein
MGEAFIVRRGGVVSETTAAPTITIIEEGNGFVTFTLTNNDDNTAIVTYEIDDEYGAVELAAAATSSNITVELDAGTYTLTAYATVVGEVASSATVSVEIEIPTFELLFDSLTADDGDPIALPQTQIDITGLSIGKNDELRLVCTSKLDNTSANTDIYWNLQVNDITSGYTSQHIFGAGSSLGAERTSTSRILITRFQTIVRKSQNIVNIKVSNNDRFVYQAAGPNYGIGAEASNLQYRAWNGVNSNTVSTITKLSVLADSSNGIGPGSRIRLYKVNTGEA